GGTGIAQSIRNRSGPRQLPCDRAEAESSENTRACLVRRRQRRCAGWVSWVFSRQSDEDLRPLTHWRSHGDLPPVGFADSFSNCHAQTCTLGLGSEKGLKNALLLLGTQSRTIVPDGDSQGRFAANGSGGANNDNVHGVVAGGQSVFQDVAKNLLQAE